MLTAPWECHLEVVRVRLAEDPTGVAPTPAVSRAAYDWSHVGQARGARMPAILDVADYRPDADAALDWARRFPPQPT